MIESHIRTLEIQYSNQEACFTGEFETPGQDAVLVNFRLPQEFVHTTGVPVETFLLVFLLPAMHAGLPLRVKGSIDTVFYRNLMEVQKIWATWYPQKYQVIPILPEALIERSVLVGSGAISCFSGGVDSCYSALELCGVEGVNTCGEPLKALMMARGMDIPYASEAVFDRAFQQSRLIADSLGLVLIPVATDARKLGKLIAWDTQFHGFLLAACLALFSHKYSLGIIPSTYSYDRLKLPWGSNPISDPLLGSGRMPILHHGAWADKFDKVTAIHGNLSVQRYLRVCWEGKELDRNCGRCFKCVATHLAFLLNGIPGPGCFPGVIDRAHLEKMPLKTRHGKQLFEVFCKAAREQGMGDLAYSLGKCIRRNKNPAQYYHRKKIIDKWLIKLHLKSKAR